MKQTCQIIFALSVISISLLFISFSSAISTSMLHGANVPAGERTVIQGTDDLAEPPLLGNTIYASSSSDPLGGADLNPDLNVAKRIE